MKPEIFWQFKQAAEGISEACRAFNTPVTGGNVSFYNENPKGAIYPTPTIGMVGILEDIEKRVPSFFQNVDDTIYVLGETFEELGGSQYLLVEHGLRMGVPPKLDLNREKALHQLILNCADKRILNSCHDIADGGLLVALSECLLSRIDHPLGAHVKLNFGSSIRKDALLFGESQSRAIVSISPEKEAEFEKLAKNAQTPIYKIGKVTKSVLEVDSLISLPSETIEKTYREAIPRRMNHV